MQQKEAIYKCFIITFRLNKRQILSSPKVQIQRSEYRYEFGNTFELKGIKQIWTLPDNKVDEASQPPPTNLQLNNPELKGLKSNDERFLSLADNKNSSPSSSNQAISHQT